MVSDPPPELAIRDPRSATRDQWAAYYTHRLDPSIDCIKAYMLT